MTTKITMMMMTTTTSIMMMYSCLQKPTFWPGEEFADVQVFSIYLEELQTMHNGRICHLAGTNVNNPVYVLYVDGYLVPERSSPGEGISADIVSIPGTSVF